MLKLIDFIALIDAQKIQDIIGVLNMLNLKDLIITNRDWYFIMLENDVKKFKDIIKVDTNASLNSYTIIDIIQTCIIKGNEYADQEQKMNTAIREINLLLSGNRPIETFRALIKDNAMLPQGLKEQAAPLYHFELQLAKQDKRDDLTHEELSAAVEVLQCVAAVNRSVDNNDTDDLFKSLTLTDSYFENLEVVNCNHYLEGLKHFRESKTKSLNPLLTHSEIQSVIDESNKQAQLEYKKVDAVQRLNNCLKLNNHKAIMAILSEPSLEFSKLSKDSSEIYLYTLHLERNKKRKSQNTDDLWFGDIKLAINSANDLLLQATRLGLKLTAINLALDKQDAVEIYHYLTNKDLCIYNVIRDCKEIYLQRMLEVKRFKVSDTENHVGSGWLQCRLADKPISFYYNVKDRCLLWNKPEDSVSTMIAKDASLLNREELQAIIDMVNTEFKRELLFLSNEDFIISMQSRIRGFLVRKKLRARLRYFTVNLKYIIKIQSFWRMYKCRTKYKKTISHYNRNISKIILVQSIWRMKMCRKLYKIRQVYYKNNISKIIKIQALWRGYLIKKNYRALLFEECPTIKTIKRFLYLLENSFNDYQEEIEIQSYKQQICNSIRQNRLLEDQINVMDIKIGLLVRNRITLEELLNHQIDLKNFRSSVTITNGINDINSNDILLQNSINRSTRQKIESYQHLFYLLQTDPNYLANLVSEMPHMQQTKFVETVIFSLYNYGSSNRDEFLLLKLFKKAVECEINTKINNHPNDFLSANPYVVKLIIGLCRTAHAQASLKQILQPLIKSVIDDENLRINTNPVEVYKHWVNELEMSTGSPCGLPYDVTLQVALKHTEVRSIIEKSVLQLKQTCQRFIRALLKSPERLPYSMRYMAKVIKECLHQKFPDHQEKDILKVVGNLIYYRYINSAIVAPDAFDMLERNIANVLPPDKRRNLASIAKLLQFATSNKGFGFESPHLAEVLNPFIRQCHEKFKEYFREVCRVDSPDVYFNMNQYTDVISLTKPVIRMTLKEIRDTHKLLLQYEDEIAPNSLDSLHELLNDLGEPPQSDYVKDNAIQTTLLWLTLQPKHETQVINNPDFNKISGDKALSASNSLHKSNSIESRNEIKANKNPVTDLALDTLFIHTKRLVIDMLNCMDLKDDPKSSSSLLAYLNSDLHKSEDTEHCNLIQNRQQLDRSLTPAFKKLAPNSRSYLMELNLSLEDKRKHIRTNLAKLETAGLVSSTNNYQDMLNAIVTDIKTLKNYRCLRKTEISHLKDILDQLGLKRQFHEDQMDYYEKYCQSCLENMNRRGKHHSRSKSQNAITLLPQNQLNPQLSDVSATQKLTFNAQQPTNFKKTIKFTANELKKKGVILEIDGLTSSQYKNLQFEITNNQDSSNNAIGEFQINAKFMGVQMDSVNLLFSDLLQMQYEGKTVMKMFDRAKVNVNLLVYIINKKFFAK